MYDAKDPADMTYDDIVEAFRQGVDDYSGGVSPDGWDAKDAMHNPYLAGWNIAAEAENGIAFFAEREDDDDDDEDDDEDDVDRCTACGRDELTCSLNPCPDVIADRGEDEEASTSE